MNNLFLRQSKFSISSTEKARFYKTQPVVNLINILRV